MTSANCQQAWWGSWKNVQMIESSWESQKCEMVKCRKHRKHRRFSRSDGLYWYDTVLVLGGNQIKQNLGDGDLWRTCAKNVIQMKPGDCAGGQCAGGVARADCRQEAGVRSAETGREYQVNTLTLTVTFRRTINMSRLLVELLWKLTKSLITDCSNDFPKSYI